MQALRARMDVRRKAMGTWGSAGGTLGSTVGTLPAANEFRTDAAVEPPAPPELDQVRGQQVGAPVAQGASQPPPTSWSSAEDANPVEDANPFGNPF